MVFEVFKLHLKNAEESLEGDVKKALKFKTFYECNLDLQL